MVVVGLREGGKVRDSPTHKHTYTHTLRWNERERGGGGGGKRKKKAATRQFSISHIAVERTR
jgi:hypothetical protein